MELDEYLRKVVCGEKGVPACALEVRRRGETVFSGYYGYADAEKRVPLTPEHLFFMYSMTKPLTVALVMQLCEEGRLSLSDPIAAYLPEYGRMTVAENGVQKPLDRPITVEHLLTMTSGVNYNYNTPAVRALLAAKGDAATTREIVKAYAEEPLSFTPGTRFLYGLGMDILAAATEVVTGERFADYAKRRVFDPLGMTRTCFHGYDTAKIAAQYSMNPDKTLTLIPKENAMVLSAGNDSGGAGLVSCAADYARLADALSSVRFVKEPILRPETVESIRTERLGRFSAGGYSCTQGPDYGYGLGVRTRVRASAYTPAGEFGWDGFGGCYAFMDDQTGLSATFTMHVCYWPRGLADIHAAIRETVYRTFL